MKVTFLKKYQLVSMLKRNNASSIMKKLSSMRFGGMIMLDEYRRINKYRDNGMFVYSIERIDN